MPKKHILICNDDGIHAPGIHALAEILRPLARVTIIAPLSEQSASSHALTLHHPLRVKTLAKDIFAVEGTPTDCVLLAVREFLDSPPDLVVSGINQGPNMGEDVLYSGTVAAAMEGALLGFASIALSLASWKYTCFQASATVARSIVDQLLHRDLPPQFLVNVNIPPLDREEIKGLRMTQLGSRIYNDAIIKKTDPRGRDYYWIGGAEPTWSPSENSDFESVQKGYVSMTPLLLDFTAKNALSSLKDLQLEL